MYIFYAIFSEIIIITIFVTVGESLRCRTDDGPSDGELKRVARSCMRKFGDMALSQNFQQQHHQQQNHHHQQQQQQAQTQGGYWQRKDNTDNRGYHYEDSEENVNYGFNDDQFYNNNNNRHHNNNNRNNHNSNNNNNGGHNDDRQRNRNRYNNNNSQNRTENENSNNYWNYSNQRTFNKEHNGNSSNNNGNRNKNNSQNSSYSDANCIVHCFFNEMHMLNNDDYPDRHKMLYILTKDIRDRELRNFYTDTIQECFRYLENQRRPDKCQFSRDLITCMTEYAKGNCDDWNEFNMMFN